MGQSMVELLPPGKGSDSKQKVSSFMALLERVNTSLRYGSAQGRPGSQRARSTGAPRSVMLLNATVRHSAPGGGSPFNSKKLKDRLKPAAAVSVRLVPAVQN